MRNSRIFFKKMKTVLFKLKDSHPSNRIQISYTDSCRRTLTIFKASWQELAYDLFDTISKEDQSLLDIKNYKKEPAVIVKPVAKESVDDLSYLKDYSREKLVAWCKENRHREMSETSVGLSMKKLGIESEKKYFNWLHDGKGGQARVWNGIKWKE